MMNRLKLNSNFILYLVCISAFFASLNQNIYSPIIPLIRDSFHVSVTMVNLSVSIFIFLTAMMQIVFGSLLDFKGARSVLIPSILLTVAASITCALTGNFTVFFISRILQAIGTAAIPLIAATTIGRLFQGNDRGSAMGTYQMLLSVAPAAAPVLGGFIGERHGYPGVFWFLVGVSVLVLLINWLFFPGDDIDRNKTVSLKTLALHYISIFKNKVGSSVLLLSFCVFFLYFSIMVYLPVLLADHYHLSIKIIGLLYLPMALSLIFGSLAYKSLQAKVSFEKLLAFGNIAASSSILLFAVAHLHTLAGTSVILALHGIAVGMLTPLFATRITDEFELNRGSAIGMFNFIRYMGMAAGPVVSGLLLNIAPSALVFGAFGILFALLSCTIFIRIR